MSTTTHGFEEDTRRTAVSPRHLLHYISADAPGPDATWSVYSEGYTHPEDDEPIDGSQRIVLQGLASEADADLVASALQRAVSRHEDGAK